MKHKNAFYAQSGGVTAVINASACGVIETARKNKIKVYAGRNGIIGALTEDLIDTSKEPAKNIAALLLDIFLNHFRTIHEALKQLKTTRL